MAAQKVALITAGSAGLGAQIARTFAPDFRLVINYANNASRADALLQELHNIPLSTAIAAAHDHAHAHAHAQTPRFHAIQADAGDKAAVHNLIAETIHVMGRLDVVVSNVGWTRVTNILDFDEGVVDQDWDRCFTYNVKTHMWLAYAAKIHLEETEGAFVSTASVAGIKPSGSSLPYAVTKAAQIHLTKALAIICAPKITFNSVSPGLLMTEWGAKFPPEKIEQSINNTKLKRLATVDDVAAQVRLLATTRSMTGQNVVVDSGFTD